MIYDLGYGLRGIKKLAFIAGLTICFTAENAETAEIFLDADCADLRCFFHHEGTKEHEGFNHGLTRILAD